MILVVLMTFATTCFASAEKSRLYTDPTIPTTQSSIGVLSEENMTLRWENQLLDLDLVFAKLKLSMETADENLISQCLDPLNWMVDQNLVDKFEIIIQNHSRFSTGEYFYSIGSAVNLAPYHKHVLGKLLDIVAVYPNNQTFTRLATKNFNKFLIRNYKLIPHAPKVSLVMKSMNWTSNDVLYWWRQEGGAMYGDGTIVQTLLQTQITNDDGGFHNYSNCDAFLKGSMYDQSHRGVFAWMRGIKSADWDKKAWNQFPTILNSSDIGIKACFKSREDDLWYIWEKEAKLRNVESVQTVRELYSIMRAFSQNNMKIHADVAKKILATFPIHRFEVNSTGYQVTSDIRRCVMNLVKL